jgi:hypothetical protein
LAWIFQHTPDLRDLTTLVFAGIGAVFTYLAWWQRNLEIKEKFFERRFQVYWKVTEAISLGTRPGNTEWMQTFYEAKHRAEFLFGPEVVESVSMMQEQLEDLLSVDAEQDSAKRIQRASAARTKIDVAYQDFRKAMGHYISIR